METWTLPVEPHIQSPVFSDGRSDLGDYDYCGNDHIVDAYYAEMAALEKEAEEYFLYTLQGVIPAK